MNAETIKFLYDILDGISKIQFHIQNINSSVEFINNVTVTDAVERRLPLLERLYGKHQKLINQLMFLVRKTSYLFTI
jgi:hypothetical protein